MSARPHSDERRHVNWVDRLILRGRNPDDPVSYLLFSRLVWAVLAVMLLAVLAAGMLAWVAQQRARDICISRNATSVQYRRALDGLAAAAERRGDRESASIYRSLTPRGSLPRC